MGSQNEIFSLAHPWKITSTIPSGIVAKVTNNQAQEIGTTRKMTTKDKTTEQNYLKFLFYSRLLKFRMFSLIHVSCMIKATPYTWAWESKYVRERVSPMLFPVVLVR